MGGGCGWGRGAAWPWGVGTGSAPCIVGVAGLGTQAGRSPPSGKSASVPPIPSPARTCAGISSSTQDKCSSCPSKCTETSPLPSSQAPASPMPPPWETRFSRNLPHQSQNLRRLAASRPRPTPCHPPLSCFPSSSPFLPPSHFPFPPWRRVSGPGMQTPLPLCKASGPHPQSTGEGGRGLSPHTPSCQDVEFAWLRQSGPLSYSKIYT